VLRKELMDAHPDRYIDSKKAPADKLEGMAYNPKKFKNIPNNYQASSESSSPCYKVSKPV